jgi:hypothetical protein
MFECTESLTIYSLVFNIREPFLKIPLVKSNTFGSFSFSIDYYTTNQCSILPQAGGIIYRISPLTISARVILKPVANILDLRLGLD